MNNQKLKVLLIVEQCNPEAASVPLVGYKFSQAISKLADVTLVSQEKNKTPLSELKEHHNITYIAESEVTKRYFTLVERVTRTGKTNCHLANVLGYRLETEFNQ